MALSYKQFSAQSYHTWPIYMLAFVRLFYVSIFERSLQNYLYFVVDIRESILGFISSVGSIAYIFAPVLGQKITKKLGIRNSLILSSVLTPLLTGAQILIPEPWFLIICRILLGLSLGIFWPNCMNLLSKWQQVSSIERSKRNFKNFNFSWNFGFISGLLIGFVWAFSWSDYFAMFISWIISFLLIPISFFIEKESAEPILLKITKFQTEDPISHIDIKEDMLINSNTPMIIYPILFSWIGIMFLATSKSVFVFGYPILLKAFESPSYLSYLIQCGLQIMQLVGLTWINSMDIYDRKTASLISMITIPLVAFLFVFLGNIWYISILTIISGLFLGLIHGTCMKIMLEYGTAKSSTKYSTINEILIGIGFGLTPIIAGYSVEIYLYSIHVFIMIFGLAVLTLLIYLSRNVKRNLNFQVIPKKI
ncbi:MAG: MFS transporter [Promethearchaeota archaeon]